MANTVSIEELLEERGKILIEMEIIENYMSAYLDDWDFVDVLNKNNPPVCYSGREYGYGLDLKANHPEKFNEMFGEWAKGAGPALKANNPEKFNEMFREWAEGASPADISVYSNLKRKLYEIEAILDER